MAGIMDSWSDATCNHHGALRDVPIGMSACGVTFRYKDADAPNPFEEGYGAVSVQECCDIVNATLMRIPGNTGCEMQFCSVFPETTTRSFDYIDLVPTTLPNGDQTYAYADPQPSAETIEGPPGRVSNCMAFVYEGELPDSVAEGIKDADYWCVVRMEDPSMSEDEIREPEQVRSAPAEWTEAAIDQWDIAFSKERAKATATNEGGAQATDDSAASGLAIGTRASTLLGTLMTLIYASLF